MAERKDVFAVVRNGEKSFWTKIGSAWVNKDASLTVRLNALPVNGELQIRDPKPKENPA
jgi:hypothetical protein